MQEVIPILVLFQNDISLSCLNKIFVLFLERDQIGCRAVERLHILIHVIVLTREVSLINTYQITYTITKSCIVKINLVRCLWEDVGVLAPPDAASLRLEIVRGQNGGFGLSRDRGGCLSLQVTLTHVVGKVSVAQRKVVIRFSLQILFAR